MRLHPGEVEADGWRAMSLEAVVRTLLEASYVVGRPRVVAVDGRGGAGKTELCLRLQELVPGSVVLHTDDVAWHQAFFDWGGLLAEHVLRPVHRGEPVSFRPPAWVERGREGALEVPAGASVLWVEGTGVIRRELDAWFDAALYVQGDLDEQERRLAARDGDTPQTRAFIDSWLAEEIPFLARERPWERATLVVDGTSSPSTGDEVFVADPALAG